MYEATIDATTNQEDEQQDKMEMDENQDKYSGYDKNELNLYIKGGKSSMIMLGRKNLRMP